MRVVVTGANGLVGSRLCRLLAERGHEVMGLSRGERRVEGAFTYAACSLEHEAEVARAFRELAARGLDAVVHTASATDVDGCERDPAGAFRGNVLAAANVASASRDAGAHLVHVSTDYVFDGEAGPYTEESAPNPKGVYATTKWMGEQAVSMLAESFAIARTAVVYGWPAAGRPNFGSWLVGLLSQGKEARLFVDQFVSPSLADNVAEMLAELAERKRSGIWNTAGSDVVDRVAYGEALCGVFGFDSKLLVPVKMRDVKLSSPRPARSGLRTDKAAGELSAKPLALDESLRRFHEAYRRGKE